MYYVKKQKVEILDPKEYRLGSRTLIGKTVDGKIVLIKDRKSRIIMKDGRKIFEQLNVIKQNKSVNTVALATQAPICGKTKKYFTENKINVLQLEK